MGERKRPMGVWALTCDIGRGELCAPNVVRVRGGFRHILARFPPPSHSQRCRSCLDLHHVRLSMSLGLTKVWKVPVFSCEDGCHSWKDRDELEIV